MEGAATVRRNGKKVATLGPGSVVGELSLLDRGPRTATVTADTDCTLLVIDSRHFAGVLQDVPTLAGKIMAVLAGRIRDFDRTIYG
jgi:CRP/FNR family transcriptional regulator, cyclic AMP receptor protein